MRIAVVGLGAVGTRAARQLASTDVVSEVILRDEHAVLPVSTLLTGQYGVTDVCLSLPCVLGARGVQRVLSPDLSEEETRGLLASATTLRAALAAGLEPPDR